MSRYIDADDLIEVIKESRPLNWTDSESEIQEDADYNHFIEMINEQPTAYDVEKVVAELEKVGNQRLEYAFGGREEWEAIAYRQGTRKAIELVRKGGTT